MRTKRQRTFAVANEYVIIVEFYGYRRRSCDREQGLRCDAGAYRWCRRVPTRAATSASVQPSRACERSSSRVRTGSREIWLCNSPAATACVSSASPLIRQRRRISLSRIRRPRSGPQVLGAIAQFEKASLVAKLKAVRPQTVGHGQALRCSSEVPGT
jgi:hypothetical protein